MKQEIILIEARVHAIVDLPEAAERSVAVAEDSNEPLPDARTRAEEALISSLSDRGVFLDGRDAPPVEVSIDHVEIEEIWVEDAP